MRGQEILPGKVIFSMSIKSGSRGDDPAVAIQLGSREKWIPNSPSVDSTGLKCCSGVGRLQVCWFDVIEGHAGAAQELSYEMVRT